MSTQPSQNFCRKGRRGRKEKRESVGGGSNRVPSLRSGQEKKISRRTCPRLSLSFQFLGESVLRRGAPRTNAQVAHLRQQAGALHGIQLVQALNNLGNELVMHQVGNVIFQ